MELKVWKKIIRSLLWAIGTAIFGGWLNGWTGAAVALAILSYWEISTFRLSNPLMKSLSKSIEKLNKKQTINQDLLEDLEKIREEFDELKREMYSFQGDTRETVMDFREKLRSK